MYNGELVISREETEVVGQNWMTRTLVFWHERGKAWSVNTCPAFIVETVLNHSLETESLRKSLKRNNISHRGTIWKWHHDFNMAKKTVTLAGLLEFIYSEKEPVERETYV